jgi:antitoxin YefM
MMIAIKTADLTQNFRKIAKRINAGETVVVSRPKNENIVLITEKEYNSLNQLRKKLALESFRKTMKEMQEEAIVNGSADMTMDEINSLVAEARQSYKSIGDSDAKSSN